MRNLSEIPCACPNPSDPEYKRFLENYSCDEEKSMANPETLLGEIEARTRELIGMAVGVHIGSN